MKFATQISPLLNWLLFIRLSGFGLMYPTQVSLYGRKTNEILRSYVLSRLILPRVQSFTTIILACTSRTTIWQDIEQPILPNSAESPRARRTKSAQGKEQRSRAQDYQEFEKRIVIFKAKHSTNQGTCPYGQIQTVEWMQNWTAELLMRQPN